MKNLIISALTSYIYYDACIVKSKAVTVIFFLFVFMVLAEIDTVIKGLKYEK